MRYEVVVKKFLSGKTGSIGNYFFDRENLYYKCLRTDFVYTTNETKFNQIKELIKNNQAISVYENSFRLEYKAFFKEVIAKRLPSGDFIGNSSVLKLVGRRFSFGREVFNTKETLIQKHLSTIMPMIPFNVFDESGLSVNNVIFLDSSGPETIKRKRDKFIKNKRVDYLENVHFTGAKLFRINDKYFLFDIDRNEIKHYIFNAFLVEINKQVNTIKEAYDALMPDIVKRSMSSGKKVLRQGEWFFIPEHVTKKIIDNNKIFGKEGKTKKEYWQRETLKLQAGIRNSPNYAQCGFINSEGVAFVTGKIEHSGREHNDLILKGWYRAIPNTSFDKSFTITGDID